MDRDEQIALLKDADRRRRSAAAAWAQDERVKDAIRHMREQAERFKHAARPKRACI